MLLEVIESAVTSDGCNHTSSGSGLDVVAEEGWYRQAYRGVPSESFHGPSTVPPRQFGIGLLISVCGGSPNGPQAVFAAAMPGDAASIASATAARIETAIDDRR